MTDRVRGAVSGATALFVAVIVGLAQKDSVQTSQFWVTNVVVLILTYLLLRYLLEPIDRSEVPPSQIPQLRDAFVDSLGNICAISSDWLDLWRTTSFIYYLHLNTTLSLINYTRGMGSPLENLSAEPTDKRSFYNRGLNLARDIGRGRTHGEYFVLRLLIYPRHILENHSAEVLALVQAHSLGRIHCIPVELEKLWAECSAEELRLINDATGALGQTIEAKYPPPARFLYALYKLGLYRRGRTAIPDVVLIDLKEGQAGESWYSSNATFKKANASNNSKSAEAFSIICRHVPSAIWDKFRSEEVGLVPVSTKAFTDPSERFFNETFYFNWINWIKRNANDEPAARRLNQWFLEEEELLRGLIGGNVRVLDVGAGYGRHAELLVNQCGASQVVGVEINWSMLRRGEEAMRALGLEKLLLLYGDAESLGVVDDDQFDVVICMTNTLGNIVPSKRPACVRSIARVLKPDGIAIFSVYNTDGASRDARVRSYRAVGLSVTEYNDCVEAKEGLRSEHFSSDRLLSTVEEDSDHRLLRVKGPDDVAGIGWSLVCRKVGQ
jgi:SAM-dependent methyltransferase